MSDVENNSPTENEEYITVWEAPKIEAPEFRLYYKKDGSVDFYTCDNPEGNYIVIDAGVFAEARPDIKVIDGMSDFIRLRQIEDSKQTSKQLSVGSLVRLALKRVTALVISVGVAE